MFSSVFIYNYEKVSFQMGWMENGHPISVDLVPCLLLYVHIIIIIITLSD